MTLTKAQTEELSRRYQQRLLGLAARADHTTSKIWDDLGSWDDADVEAFTTRAAPVVVGARSAAAALAVGYLQVITGKPHAVDLPSFAAVPDLRDPFVAYWAALARGDRWEDAISSGSSRAGGLAVDGVHEAAREAATVIDKRESRITGWTRMLSGAACDWCTTVAQATYRTAESASFGHNRCDCVPVPIIR